MSKLQTMQFSGETARYELSHMNLRCLQKPLTAFGTLSKITKDIQTFKCLRFRSVYYVL